MPRDHTISTRMISTGKAHTRSTYPVVETSHLRIISHELLDQARISGWTIAVARLVVLHPPPPMLSIVWKCPLLGRRSHLVIRTGCLTVITTYAYGDERDQALQLCLNESTV